MANQQHQIKEIKIFSDGGTAGQIIFEFKDGGNATISASIEQPIQKELEQEPEATPPARRKRSSST